jgi:hypothetical protein
MGSRKVKTEGSWHRRNRHFKFEQRKSGTVIMDTNGCVRLVIGSGQLDVSGGLDFDVWGASLSLK